MQFSDDYTKVYDLLNGQKSYAEECRFILEILSSIKPTLRISSILDLGCGSGNHIHEFERLLGSNLDIVGVDTSEAFCTLARNNLSSNVNIFNSKISDFNIGSKFDLVISLFHVINYQTKVHELLSFLNTIKIHLSNRGLAIVDFWNKSAWVNDPPITRSKEILDEDFLYIRESIPKSSVIDGSLVLSINLSKFEKQTNTLVSSTLETHHLRAFTPFEIEIAASIAGLKIVKIGKWLQMREGLEVSDWYGYVVLESA